MSDLKIYVQKLVLAVSRFTLLLRNSQAKSLALATQVAELTAQVAKVSAEKVAAMAQDVADQASIAEQTKRAVDAEAAVVVANAAKVELQTAIDSLSAEVAEATSLAAGVDVSGSEEVIPTV